MPCTARALLHRRERDGGDDVAGVEEEAALEGARVPGGGRVFTAQPHHFIEDERQALKTLANQASVDGRLRPFRNGAFRLAATSGCPLVPIAVAGSIIYFVSQSQSEFAPVS